MPFLTNYLLSPAPTVAVALINVAAAHYFKVPIYKFGFYYTGTMLGLGLIGSIVGGLLGKYWTRKDPSIGIVAALMFLAPTGIASYKVATFWMTLFMVNNLLQFGKFIS